MTEPPAYPPPGWATPGSPPPPPPPPGYFTAPSTNPWYVAPPPQPGVVPLRPLGLGEILDGAIKVVRRYPRPTLGLAAVVSLVATALDVMLVLLYPTPVIERGSDLVGAASGGVFRSLATGLVSYLAGLVLTGALIFVVGQAVQGKPADIADAWAVVAPRLGPLLGLSLLTGLMIAGPAVVGIAIAAALVLSTGPVSLVLGIPLGICGFLLSIYLAMRLSLAPAALILEKTGVKAALRRSGVLVKGSWWRVFGILILAAIIAGVLNAIFTFPISIAAVVVSAGHTTGTGFQVAQRIGAGFASVLVTPFSAGVSALLYVDRRMRAEGLDVALRAATATGQGG